VWNCNAPRKMTAYATVLDMFLSARFSFGICGTFASKSRFGAVLGPERFSRPRLPEAACNPNNAARPTSCRNRFCATCSNETYLVSHRGQTSACRKRRKHTYQAHTLAKHYIYRNSDVRKKLAKKLRKIKQKSRAQPPFDFSNLSRENLATASRFFFWELNSCKLSTSACWFSCWCLFSFE